MKDRLLTLLKIVISLGLIAYLLFVKVDLALVGRALARANFLYILLGLALYFAAITAGCFKWKLLLRALQIDLPLPRLLGFTLVGLFFGNFLMPIIAGDVVRGYDLARSTERTAEAAVSVLVDKLVGLLAFITAGAALTAYAVFGLGRSDLRVLALAAGVAFLAFALLFASVLSRRLRGLFERLFRVRLFAPAAPIYRKLSDALQAYRDNLGALAQAFLISLGVLLITNIVNWLLAQAVGAGIPLVYIFIFNPLIAFAPLLLPSIGGLGVNQGAFDLFYATLGGTTTSELAVTFSLLMQLIVYVTSLPGGVLWLRKRRRRPAAGEPAP
jgi:uncharacterized protein (TIRG00374 family)